MDTKRQNFCFLGRVEILALKSKIRKLARKDPLKQTTCSWAYFTRIISIGDNDNFLPGLFGQYLIYLVRREMPGTKLSHKQAHTKRRLSK